MKAKAKAKSRKRTTGFRAWRPTDEDEKIVSSLIAKLGVDHTQIVRLAIRKLAEHEGVRAA